MNTLSIRGKQLLYGALILALLVGVAWYSPMLQERREEYDLGEATFGQVDTGGFLLKLAMVGGMRGPVANWQWMQAQDLQRRQEWDALKAKVDFISKLQPHFLSPWTFQGWNLAYNVSVEWDDPADKYHWIRQGIEFVKDGVEQNPKSPDLTWDTAWFYYHKLGFSDESIILRRLYHDDDSEGAEAFKTNPITDLIEDDSFRIAGGWFENAIDKADEYQRLASDFEAGVEYVDPQTNKKGRPGDLAFRTMPGHAASRYASSLEKRSMVGIDARFGEFARFAWRDALAEWEEVGEHVFPSPNAMVVGDGVLTTQPILLRDIFRTDEIEALGDDPAYWEQLLGIDGITPEQARMLADNQNHWADRWAYQVNYPYWLDRSRAEMTTEGVLAREKFYQGTLAFLAARYVDEVDDEGNTVPGSASLFREGLELWEEVLEDHPQYRNDELNKRDTGQVVYRYAQALKQAGRELPEDTPFLDLMPEADIEPTLDPFDALDMLGLEGSSDY